MLSRGLVASRLPKSIAPHHCESIFSRYLAGENQGLSQVLKTDKGLRAPIPTLGAWIWTSLEDTKDVAGCQQSSQNFTITPMGSLCDHI